MTAEVILCGGKRVLLPPLLQWSVCRTDGDPCGSFRLRVCMAEKSAQILDKVLEIRCREGAKTVFAGVVDDAEILVSEDGIFLEMTGRSMAAKLLDNQVRAQEFVSAQLTDILKTYVYPYGIDKVDADRMDAVPQFVVETGYTCWQVLAGFCRHSADIFPRFSADGTLILKKNADRARFRILPEQILSLRDGHSRYAAASKQTLINTRNGQLQTAVNEAFTNSGVKRERVAALTGTKLRANFRTAQQRIDDTAKLTRQVQIELLGSFLAEPCDLVELSVPQIGLSGVFSVQAVKSGFDDTGRKCTLDLYEMR